jgi:uncharacterized protein (DUF427 family)
MDPYGYADRPDYRVDLLARRNLVRAVVGDTLLAESTECILVDEQDHGLVFYFPRRDVRLAVLEATDDTSICPFKGRASYWTLPGSGIERLAWSYEEPHAEVARLAGYIAFFQDRVRLEVGVATPAVSGR